MTKLWKFASTVAALSVMAFGGVELATTPAHADAVVPLYASVPDGCQASRIQVPTAGGLQWNKLITCPDSD
jgi:hypothetical protein